MSVLIIYVVKTWAFVSLSFNNISLYEVMCINYVIISILNFNLWIFVRGCICYLHYTYAICMYLST